MEHNHGGYNVADTEHLPWQEHLVAAQQSALRSQREMDESELDKLGRWSGFIGWSMAILLPICALLGFAAGTLQVASLLTIGWLIVSFVSAMLLIQSSYLLAARTNAIVSQRIAEFAAASGIFWSISSIIGVIFMGHGMIDWWSGTTGIVLLCFTREILNRPSVRALYAEKSGEQLPIDCSTNAKLISEYEEKLWQELEEKFHEQQGHTAHE